jgi:thymidylate synthase (FAD)
MTQIITQLNPDVPPTGSDLGIVNAARKSFGRRSEWDVSYDCVEFCGVNVLKDKDKRLLEFLARGMTAVDFTRFKLSIESSILGIQDDVPECYEDLVEKLWEWRNTPTHDTPFNHGFFSFEVKAPVFVARHLVKHEYLIMSEYSRRYITDDVEFYEHTYRSKAEDVKQGSGGVHKNSGAWQIEIDLGNTDAVGMYNRMLDDGIAPEQARGHLPQDLMTAWTWSGTLGAFANMCKLRLSSDTQDETTEVAKVVYEELKKQFPVAAPLLVEGVL